MTIKTQEELQQFYDGISASSLNYFDVSPRYYRDKVDKKIIDPPSPESKLGNQTHSFILEPENFKETYIQLNFDKPRGKNQELFCELCANAKANNESLKAIDIAPDCYEKAYSSGKVKKSENKIKEEAMLLYEQLNGYITYLTLRKKEKEIISDSTMRYLHEAKRAIQKHELANALMFNEEEKMFGTEGLEIYNEKLILWEYPNLTVNNKPVVCKSFIDRVIIDHNKKEIKLIDFKTTNKLHDLTKEKIKERNYHRQLSFYWMALHYYFKQQYPDKNLSEYTKDTYIVGIQTINRYQQFVTECKVIKITEPTLMEGFESVENTITNISWHMENNKWDFTRFHYEHDIDLIV